MRKPVDFPREAFGALGCPIEYKPAILATEATAFDVNDDGFVLGASYEFVFVFKALDRQLIETRRCEGWSVNALVRALYYLAVGAAIPLECSSPSSRQFCPTGSFPKL